MYFKNVDKKYRPIPFWSWNDKLEVNETVRQVRIMDNAGMGGFFMHARGGLQTEYMEDEWFENVTAAVNAAHECGMKPWAYDENGWPSGFGNGSVTGLGINFQQKYLRMENNPEHAETQICKCGNHWFYYEVNPFYVDVLDENVIEVFIKNIYSPYYEKYENRIEGFFIDEPQISRKGIPWSFVFEKEYRNRYGENIYEHLEELYLEIGDYINTRMKFWKMVTELFSSACVKQIYDWCDERNLKLTGHLLLEETLFEQLTTNGACMPHYEYFHIPGMDWLGRGVYDCLTARQVGSVAAQLGKSQVLSETFACSGHNVSFDELKGIYESHLVRGANLLCQHLEGYSIRGLRKRDHPPAMYIQQPWWDSCGGFIEAMSRVGMILSVGEERVSTLVLHPMTSAWTLYNGNNDRWPIDVLHKQFMDVIKNLEKKHIEFHLGDELIMERHAFTDNGYIVIGNQRYDTLVMPPYRTLLPFTKNLIDEFAANGGKIVSAAELKSNAVIDNENITYTSRYFNGYKVHYFVNSSAVEQTATLGVEGKRIDIYSGETVEQTERHTFEPWGSLMLVEDGSHCVQNQPDEKNYIYPDGKFRICGGTENVLLLDRCDYYFDGALQEKNGYVLNIAERANRLGKKIALKQEYHIKTEYIPEKLYLVCETPEKFDISVNGHPVKKEACGSFIDAGFKRLEISEYMVCGENLITFCCDFVQREEFYKNLENAYMFESEKNKLAYDIEIEAIMLVGQFSVATDGKWLSLNNDAFRYCGDFVIQKPVKEIEMKSIQKQGFPFFCGKLMVEKEVEVDQNTVLKMCRKGVNSVIVEVDGNKKVVLTGNGEIALGKLAERGTHTLKLTLINNLRNLLGPHHLKEGECLNVWPGNFFKEPCVWNPEADKSWDDDYCFVEISI